MSSLILPRRFGQDQGILAPDYDNPITVGIRLIFSAPTLIEPVRGRSWTRSNLALTGTKAGIAAVCSQAASKYASILTPVPPTTGWTIAAQFVPRNYPTSGHDIVGFCEAPLNATRDRSIAVSTGGALGGYIYDGAEKRALVAGTATAGTLETIVVTCSASLLSTYRVGAGSGKATVAVSNSGYTGYTTPEFCVGAGTNVAGDSDIILALLADRPWSEDEAWSWIYEPSQIFKTKPRRVYFSAASGAGIAPATGGYTYTGNTPAINQPRTVAPSSGAYTVAGNTPVISQPRTLAPAVGSYAYLGNTPEVSQIAGIRPTTGGYVYAGNTPSISQPRTIAPLEGGYAYAGNTPTVGQSAGVSLSPEDLAAIADAMWSSPEAVAAHAKLDAANAKLDAILVRITC